MRPLWPTLAIAAVVALAAPAAAQAVTRDYAGPMRFCAGDFAIDLAAGEKATVSDPQLDFLVTYFDLSNAQIGVYQGSHPQDDGKRRRIRWFGGVVLHRLTEGDAVSYLIRTDPNDDFASYLHIFSETFGGGDGDRAILSRLQLADRAKAGCARSTYDPRGET